MPTRSLSTVQWKAEDILTNDLAFGLCKKDELRLVLFLFYITAHLYLSLRLSAIIAINSEFVGLPRLF